MSHPRPSVASRLGPAALLLGVLTLPLAGLLAQETASKPAKRIHWSIQAPIAGVPCPSHVQKLDAPESCVFGTFPLATSRKPVVDGDTIRVEGKQESLRLIGLDCEETFKDEGKRQLARADWNEYVKTELAGHDPARPPKYATWMGEAAKDFAEQFFAGKKTVRLEWDEPSRKIDTYGRHLVLILVEDAGHWVNFNVEVVRQGLSPYFVKYGRSVRYHDAFVAAQKEAQTAGRGIWATPGPFQHYPDYAVRLAWWNERDAAIAEAEAFRKTHEDLFILGVDAEWQRLLKAEGKPVTVFGSTGDVKTAGEHVIQHFNHAKGVDFAVVGSRAEIDALAFTAQEGNLLYLHGTLELYQGKPQFRAATVKVTRKPPEAAAK